MTRRRWIFFDLGWTLVDESAAHLARFDKLRASAPRYATISDERFVRTCEENAARFAPSPFLAALRSLDPTGWESAKGVGAYDHALERLYPEVPRVLAALRGSFELGVIANQSAGTAHRLQRFGVRDFFSVIVASAETGIAKPDPRIFAHAQASAGCQAEDATMVGDRLDNDIGPAKSAGWRTVRVLRGFSRLQRPRCEEERPDLTISSLAELPSHLG